MKKSYTAAILTTICLFNVSSRVSHLRYQLTTLNYVYYGTNLGASYEPVNVACACNFHIADSYLSTANPTFSSKYIFISCQSRPVHSEVRQQHSLLVYFIAFSPYLLNPSTLIYTTPSGRLSSAKLLR